jgi:rubrerythrin
MAFDFNADEIFEMAEQIEINGANFYREMADNISELSIRRLFLDLAAMEDIHKKVFSEMRANLSDQDRESTLFDPDGESAQYLRALADLRVFTQGVEERFTFPGGSTETEKYRKVFWAAIGREKESIVFYLGLKGLVPEKLGKDKIDDIIQEEMKHLRILSNKLAALKD